MRTALYAVILIALTGSLELRAQTPTAKAQKCDNPPEGPLTLGKIILEVHDQVRCVVQYVQKNHVVEDLYRIPLVEQVLKDVDAPPGLIDLIPLPPEPPKPKLAGPLTISCSPDDCEFTINGHDYGSTVGRKKVIPDLPVGSAVIQIRSQGYIAKTKPIELMEGSPLQEDFLLFPNSMARRELGRDQLLGAVKNFGGLPGLFSMADEMEARGTATVLGEKQQLQAWPTNFNQTWNRIGVRFIAKGGKPDIDVCNITAAGGITKSSECKGKLKVTNDQTVLTNAVLALSKYQVHQMLSQLLSRDVELVDSANPAVTQIKTVDVDGSDSYEVSFDDKGLPSVILYRSKPEASPIKIEYSKYSDVQGHQYPYRLIVSETSPEKLLVDFITDFVARPEAPTTKRSGK